MKLGRQKKLIRQSLPDKVYFFLDNVTSYIEAAIRRTTKTRHAGDVPVRFEWAD